MHQVGVTVHTISPTKGPLITFYAMFPPAFLAGILVWTVENPRSKPSSSFNAQLVTKFHLGGLSESLHPPGLDSTLLYCLTPILGTITSLVERQSIRQRCSAF